MSPPDRPAPPAAQERLLRERLQRAGYLADADLATTVWLSSALQRPLLLEGDAGVGKTALATALAQSQGATLVRLQCFEGLDLAQAAYEWNYGRQLMAIRLSEADKSDKSGTGRVRESDVFSREYLLERPLLCAISQTGPCVLLIDEIDRADEAFEAFLLEILADYQITVPEIGTLRATHIPQVILTSNGTRELSDALRRRCLYHYLDYPTLAREIAIVKATLPEADTRLVEDAVQFVQRLRREDLAKMPGIAETLDWVRALFQLQHHSLPDDMAAVLGTLGCLLKTREDRFMMSTDRLRQLVEGRRSVGVAEKVAASAPSQAPAPTQEQA
ncbi:MAG: ATPase [Polaromonas sp. 39-63-203]|jgi:MoxR-like ATPase|uniref:AAA family ATPase n=1 Tax=Polaromonas sp. TaxID=1869339 RepID=UPI000BCFDFFF|nr:MoxR family ATPase [Polaromonas sp.]OYY53541.1 MAG: ATPase [Polaromonas sp. 35-63-240]OYZ84572.1 MAG: ATPase [Polaromonas sp. 24-62-144]OZB00497.1 MAG: ATPase [Polaromonas sp. 39-63-203]HQS31431.1 MoxR family ATPase [Polaromonas sp.]HQS90765.1 MoxR family ATPase [Polaromonas sp.]